MVLFNQRKKQKKIVKIGTVHVKTSFNNTILSLSDILGNTLCWSSAGTSGFKGARKNTAFAAQSAARNLATKASEFGLQKIDIIIKGRGNGRETTVRALKAAGLNILSVADNTALPHNGCRAPKKRRV